MTKPRLLLGIAAMEAALSLLALWHAVREARP